MVEARRAGASIWKACFAGLLGKRKSPTSEVGLFGVGFPWKEKETKTLALLSS